MRVRPVSKSSYATSTGASRPGVGDVAGAWLPGCPDWAGQSLSALARPGGFQHCAREWRRNRQGQGRRRLAWGRVWVEMVPNSRRMSVAGGLRHAWRIILGRPLVFGPPGWLQELP